MIMVHVSEGDEPIEVPLAYYDENGDRHIVGKAAVQIKNGEVIALGQINAESPISREIRQQLGSMNLETFSIGPFVGLPPAEEASRRLSPYSLASRTHVTDSNPNGEVRQCNRRDLHEPHEYQAEFGAYFDVYCPGNTGSQR
jgi:hypothetical protein